MSRLTQYRLASLAGICFGLGFVLLFSVPSARPLNSRTSQATRTPAYAPTATPPTQGGHGANLFYLYCMPCHGDEGQGLTDEFRTRQYPPEDVNCWNSGCHGDRPYEGGFTLPQTVPALIGPDTLERFNTASDVYDFTRSAMPFNAPGSLSQTEYMQLTVFLLERNGVVPAGTSLDPPSAATVFVHAVPPTSAPGVFAQPVAGGAAPVALVGVAILLIGAAGFALFKRRPSR